MNVFLCLLAGMLLPLSLSALNSGRVHLHGSVNLNNAEIESGGKGTYLKFSRQPELNGKVVTFDLTGSEPVSVSGSSVPTALTFSGNEAAGYTLLDYWTAQDGTRYAASIRETFTPLAAQRLFAGETVYSRQLGTNNRQKAQAAWEQAHAEKPGSSGPVQGSAVQVAFAEDALAEDPARYDSFTDSPSDSMVRLVFTADGPASDFRFLALTLLDVDADGAMRFSIQELYAVDRLPVVIETTFAGDVPDRGITYIDANGFARYFALAASGADGSPLLLEFSV